MSRGDDWISLGTAVEYLRANGWAVLVWLEQRELRARRGAAELYARLTLRSDGYWYMRADRARRETLREVKTA